MGDTPIPGRFLALPVEPQGSTLEQELEEAADLLPHQEPTPAEQSRPDPAGPIDYADPSLIDPAD
jgi:hypothetical protein